MAGFAILDIGSFEDDDDVQYDDLDASTTTHTLTSGSDGPGRSVNLDHAVEADIELPVLVETTHTNDNLNICSTDVDMLANAVVSSEDPGTVGTTPLSTSQPWHVLLAFGQFGRAFQLLCDPETLHPIKVALPAVGDGGGTREGFLIPAALRIARGVFRNPYPTKSQILACVNARVLPGRRTILLVVGLKLCSTFSTPYTMKIPSRVILPDAGEFETSSDRADMKEILDILTRDMTWLLARVEVALTEAGTTYKLVKYGIGKSREQNIRTVMSQTGTGSPYGHLAPQ